MADFIAGALGGACGVMVGYPMDTVKVRIQTQKKYSGIWHCVRSTYQMEKVSGFFKGMSMSISTRPVCSSVIFGVYRNCLHNLCKIKYGSPYVKPSKLDVFLSGYTAGGVQALVSYPVDMAKVRLQTQVSPHRSSSCAPPARPRYSGPLHCLLTVARQEGLTGLYKGCFALMFRDCHSFATYFLSYSVLRERLVSPEKSHTECLGILLAGGLAGVLAWSIGTPMDVIKARLQADGVSRRRYRGIFHCVSHSVRTEGVGVLFKGLSLNCLRAFPVNMVVFLTYEAILKQIKPVSR